MKPEKIQQAQEQKIRAIQQIRSKALNAIAKIYHPKFKFHYNQWLGDESYSEQREYYIRNVIENMNKEIIAAKKKFKKKTSEQ